MEKLEGIGHTAIAVDLPGRDAQGDAAKAITLEAYIDTVAQVIEASNEPVTLVGHSFGGMTISGVAERMPNEFDKLIYVAAYVPLSGESMETLALSDADNRFNVETFVISKDYAHAEILESDQIRVFAQDAEGEEIERLKASIVREPLAPIGTPLSLIKERFGGVAKAYVRTTDDGTVSASLQTMMLERAGITQIVDIDSGHAVYLTEPDALAAALDALAK